MEPNKPTTRINVTAEEQQQRLEAEASLTFEAQKDAIRRANSVLLSRTLKAIESGASDEATITALAKCSTIARSWVAEERQQGDPRDLTKLTDDEIKQRLGR